MCSTSPVTAFKCHKSRLGKQLRFFCVSNPQSSPGEWLLTPLVSLLGKNLLRNAITDPNNEKIKHNYISLQE